MDKNILYEEFVFTIVNIIKSKNIKNVLTPLNFEEDKKILHNFFIKSILELNNNNLNINWTDDEWVESMKNIRLGLLSFMRKNKASLYTIYNIVEDDIEKHLLLERYKNLINNFIIVEKMSCANKFLLEENIILDELQNKNYYLFLNLKHIKTPKYLAYLLDVISNKQYRRNLMQVLVDGSEKIELKKIIEINEEDSYEFIESFLSNLEKNNIYKKIINFIMRLDLNGEILIKKDVYNSIYNYVKELINNSTILTNFLNNINSHYKTNPTKFKNEIKILFLPENINLTSKKNIKNDMTTYKDFYNQKRHINLQQIQYDKIYNEVFLEEKEYFYNKNDIILRIVNLVSLLIEYIAINYFESKETKINTINKIFSNYDILKKFNIDIDTDNEMSELFKNIKENGLIKNDERVNPETYDNSKILTEILEKIKNNLQNNQNSKYFYTKISEFIYILKNINLIDITKINKDEFNLCTNFIKELTENTDNFKSFIFHLIEEEHFSLFLTCIEKKSILKINKQIKEKLVELILKLINEIVKIIQKDDQKQTQNFIKFLLVLAKGSDMLIYFFKVTKQNKKSENKVQLKKQVVYR